MRLPTAKKVLREDVKDAPGWIVPLIDTLNTFMETIYQAMNRNITFHENISCMLKELTYKTPSTYPTGVADMEFTSALKSKAIGLWPIQVIERTTYLPPPGPVWVPWVEDNGVIIVGTITGLEADKTYTVRLLIN